MKRTTRLVSIGALATAAALTLAGCGGGAASSSQSTKPATAKSLPQTAWHRADYASVKEGGTLTLALDQLPDNWNPLQADGSNVPTIQVIDPTQGGPVRIKEDGTWTVNPDYASEVKLISSDPQTVEVKLNPKAVWSDGTPITYKDFVATWQADNGTNKAFQNAAANVFQDIGSITPEGTSQYNFKIVYKNKDADWPSILTADMLVPAHLASTPAGFNNAFKSKPMPSMGPYVVSKIDTTGQVVTMKRNPKWWGEKGKLDTIVFKVVSRDGLAQAYANKEIDVVNIGTDKDNYDTAKKRSDGVIEQSAGLTWNHITLNGSRGPLADVKVRQAIGHAIDRTTIAESRLTPIGAPVELQGSYIYMPGQKGYKDESTSPFSYDLAKAGRLLDEAGYKKGSNGMREKDGKPLTITYTLDANNPTSAQTFKQIQAFLKKVGINVTDNTVPEDKYFSDYVTPKNFEMTGFAWQGTAFPVSTVESLFYPVDAGQNYTGVTDDKLGALFATANSELDPAKRITDANEIDKDIMSYVPVIPLIPTPNTYGVKKGLVNYGATQFETIDWTKVGWMA